VNLTTLFNLILPRSRMRGVISPLPYTPSWRGAELKHMDNFTLYRYLSAETFGYTLVCLTLMSVLKRSNRLVLNSSCSRDMSTRRCRTKLCRRHDTSSSNPNHISSIFHSDISIQECSVQKTAIARTTGFSASGLTSWNLLNSLILHTLVPFNVLFTKSL